MKFYTIIVILALFLVVDARLHLEEANKNLTVLEKHFKVGDGDIEGFFGDMQGTIIDCSLKDAPPCCTQHQVDKLFDVAYHLGDIGKEDKKQELMALAISLLLTEKNTPPGKRAEVCKEKPRHKELDGLAAKMKQDPKSKKNSKPYKPTSNKEPKNFVLKLGGKVIAPNCNRFPSRDPRDKCSTKQ